MVWIVLIAAAAGAPFPLVASSGGGVSFRGDSSAGVVNGRLDVFTVSLDLAAGTGSFVADPASLTTGLGPRDQHMLVYALDVATFPEVRFDVNKIERPAAASPLDGPVSLVGTLTLHGVSMPLTVVAMASGEGAKLRLKGEVPLVLADFGIPDPSVVIAAFAPSIHLTFDLIGEPAP